MNLNMRQWQLRKGMDRRVKSGHPWVYSNELSGTPKGISPGEFVELRDATGRFIAYGFGNPNSLIAFRVVTRDSTHTYSRGFLHGLLSKAAEFRMRLGRTSQSFRMFYGEADGLPGLVIDVYGLADGQVFVIQAHTAGADRILNETVSVLEELCETSDLFRNGVGWARTAVIFRNDIEIRKLEGLSANEPMIVKDFRGVQLQDVRIRMSYAGQEDIQNQDVRGGETFIELEADLLCGQKTGLFLDQFSNLSLLIRHLESARVAAHKSEVRVLDLFSYVGHWSTQLSRFFKDRNVRAEFTCVDVSEKALSFAERNIKRQKQGYRMVRADLFKDKEIFLNSAALSGSFDLIILDPPALIKGRKNIAVGARAYRQLNSQVIGKLASGGTLVTHSCSSLLSEAQFQECLGGAVLRSQKKMMWIARGCQSQDHPVLAEFPEGQYLKTWIGMLP